MNTFNPDSNSRGGSPFGFGNASDQQRGGTGANGQMPHSAHGFRKALMKTARSAGNLKDQMTDKMNFGGKGYRKPNYFAQGGQRHGMHIGSGAPFVGPAAQEASEGFGGE